MALDRYNNRKADWVFIQAFKQIFEEAKLWIAAYEEQRKKALSHCGSCWAKLKKRSSAKGKKTTYCSKGCECLCNTTKTCVVHFECTCLTSWICEFHKRKRPDVAVALYNALPPTEHARLILINSFAPEGIDPLSFKRLGRKPKEATINLSPSAPSTVKKSGTKEEKQVELEQSIRAQKVTDNHLKSEIRSASEIVNPVAKISLINATTNFDLASHLEAKLADYAKYLKKQPLSDHSKRNYLSRLRAFIAFLKVSQCEYAPLKPSTKEEPVKQLCVHLKKTMKLMPATINSYLSAIDSLYGFLGLGKLEVERNEVQQYLPSGLSAKEQQKFLAAVKQTRRVKDRAIATLLFNTGIKLSECSQLSLSDISITGRKKTVVIKSENGNQREVPLNSVVCEILQEWLAERSEKYAGKESSPTVFLNPQGNRMLPNAIYEVVRKIGRECNLDLSPHILRDTFLANLISSEKELLFVADVAGHRSMNTTKRYAVAGMQK